MCLGNICRSPAAQAVMQRIIDERCLNDCMAVDSAGMSSYHQGDLPDRRMRVHARQRGIDLTHRSRPVRPTDFETFDLIVAMDNGNYDQLRDMASTVEEMDKVVKIAQFFRLHTRMDCIPDPYYGGSEGFETVLDLLEDACTTIADIFEKDKL